ncbi:DUF1593 domain-containing protein [Aquiflexum gelatinilyticum]|uniref:DUF1593 domain-containing protein n=1 Tax=Aquiflexum gelatinilyticum TaxID=2961943 RepID=A0A9X2P8R0_9BACT|nr:DUF1593 domain-containing protein [Aquiflexum gelatinilyticum]MCR9015492.1 DUF1593 domain-containing protein [Aquiflexum gelatinilyticum]
MKVFNCRRFGLMASFRTFLLLLFSFLSTYSLSQKSSESDSQKPQIIISTDIGGDDPDDYQSMVHLLVYADRFDILGLISSPPGNGRISNIMESLEAYEKDFPKLKAKNAVFPTPEYLRSITKQGALDIQQSEIPENVSEGAKWIIEKVNESNSPIYVLVWGSMTDVAQAVHADPSIKNKLRLYSIGSWNTAQDPKSRDYLFNIHPDLWWIENNKTFRGMYMGGDQSGNLGNQTFVETFVKYNGYLGKLFWEQKQDIKMGDTPSVLYFLHGDMNNPEGESWGGSFVKTDHGPNYWTDNPHIDLIENGRQGAKTVNRFRKDFLMDWAKRMSWLKD